jgi:hypothetical protein
MFVGKAGSLLLSVASERCLIQIGSGLTLTDNTRQERLATNKHSGFFRTFVNYERKKFYDFVNIIGLFTAVF